MPTSSFHAGIFVCLEFPKVLGAFVTAIRQAEEVEKTQIGRNDVIVSLSADDGILHTQDSKESVLFELHL